jgi:hypothetical protein
MDRFGSIHTPIHEAMNNTHNQTQTGPINCVAEFFQVLDDFLAFSAVSTSSIRARRQQLDACCQILKYWDNYHKA